MTNNPQGNGYQCLESDAASAAARMRPLTYPCHWTLTANAGPSITIVHLDSTLKYHCLRYKEFFNSLKKKLKSEGIGVGQICFK